MDRRSNALFSTKSKRKSYVNKRVHCASSFICSNLGLARWKPLRGCLVHERPDMREALSCMLNGHPLRTARLDHGAELGWPGGWLGGVGWTGWGMLG